MLIAVICTFADKERCSVFRMFTDSLRRQRDQQLVRVSKQADKDKLCVQDFEAVTIECGICTVVFFLFCL